MINKIHRQQQQLTTESNNKNTTSVKSKKNKQNKNSKKLGLGFNNQHNKEYYIITDENCSETDRENLTRLLGEIRYYNRRERIQKKVIRILQKMTSFLLLILIMLGLYYYHYLHLPSYTNSNNNAAIGGVTAATAATMSSSSAAAPAATPMPGSSSSSSSQKKREQERDELINDDNKEDTTTTTTDTIPTSDVSSSSSSDTDDTVTIMTNDWTLLHTYPHDPTSFTQGLEVVPFHRNHDYDHDPIMEECSSNTNSGEDGTSHDDVDVEVGDDKAVTTSCRSNNNNNNNDELLLMESTGMHGQSLIRIWNPKTGTTIQETKLDSTFFGEGICRYTDYENEDDTTGREFYVQLTYQEETILIYDAHTLEEVRRFPWPSTTTTKEGWGIAYNPTERVFYVSDGSQYIHVWDTQFQEIPDRKMEIHIHEMKDIYGNIYFPRKTTTDDVNGTPQHHTLNYINELDYDPTTHTILANKIFEDIILRIDPQTGMVLNVYDFSKLYPRKSRHQGEDVFNGIALIPNTNGKEWFVTGKYWSSIYHVRINL